MDEGINDFGNFEDCHVSAESRMSPGAVPTPDSQGDATSKEKSEEVSSSPTNQREQQGACATSVLSATASGKDACSTKLNTGCVALSAGGDCSTNITDTSSTAVGTVASVSAAVTDIPNHEESDESGAVSSRTGATANAMPINANEVESSSGQDHALDDSSTALGYDVDHDRDEIRALLEHAVDTVVRREEIQQYDDVAKDDTILAAAKPQAEPDQDQLCDKDESASYSSDAEDDFAEFSVPPEDARASQRVPVVANGDAADEKPTEDEQIDDDFGDFDQATFDEQQSEGFANFEAVMAPAPPMGSALLDDVRPLTMDVFRATINSLFTAEDPPNETDQDASNGHLAMDDADYAVFAASVQQDVSRCENVDDWPCVVFRYENSVTRKGLLSALCIDETPANCPRFAIDCLSKAFLQPVKQSGSSMKASHSPGLGSNPTGGTDIGRQGRLSDAAKEVLNKIPDLSFMKAEVLTFPAAGQAPLGVDL